MAGIPIDILTQGDKFFKEYEGSFTENFIAQQLKALLNIPLYYWKSEGKMAEIDFLCEIDENIFPLEIKAGINPRSKSLKSYDTKFHPRMLIRSTLLNLKHDGKILNIPLYAISCLKNFIKNMI